MELRWPFQHLCDNSLLLKILQASEKLHRQRLHYVPLM